MENRENFGPVWFERVFNKSRGLGWWGYGLNGLRYQPKGQQTSVIFIFNYIVYYFIFYLEIKMTSKKRLLV